MLKRDTHQVSHDVIEDLIRCDWGRLMAALIHYFGDFDLAEDALQDAVEEALVRWPVDGLPQRPDAWLLQVARRRALNAIKRVQNFDSKKHEVAARMYSNGVYGHDSPNDSNDEIPDERLCLIFTCCHPAFSLEARVALTLRTVGGLSTAEIARVFIVPESTMAQRLVRAKRKIRMAGIRFEFPPRRRWAARMSGVMHVLYFIYNEGYSTSAGPVPTRSDLCEEAIYLARTLRGLAPDEPEVVGLLALMLFHEARRAARTDEHGDLLTLEDQDRTRWNREVIAEADRILIDALRRRDVGEYQLQAAIAGIHAQSESFEATDWDELVQLYDVLCSIHPSKVFRLNRAVALSFAAGPVDGLAALEDFEADLSGYLPFHAAKGDFLRRLGRHEEAINAYVKAVKLAGNEAERRFFRRRLAGWE